MSRSWPLGIPFTPALAVVLGALLLHGITPGPNLINEKPELFWTLIASMYIGNFMLLVLNLPLVNVFISILKVPRKLLLPLIAIICLIGVYSIGSSYLDLVILAVLGIAGYAIRGTGYEPAPLVLALVLGPMIETALRQSLKLTRGDIGPIIFRPICIVIYSILILSFLAPAILKLFMQRRKAARGTVFTLGVKHGNKVHGSGCSNHRRGKRRLHGGDQGLEPEPEA